MRNSVIETLAAGNSASAAVSPDVIAESGDGSDAVALQMADSVDLEDLKDAIPPDPPLAASPVRSGGRSYRKKPIAKRSFPSPSQLLNPVLVNPRDCSEMDTDENWLYPASSSPISNRFRPVYSAKEAPLCLDIVPYERRVDMETDGEENPLSKSSPPGPEEDGVPSNWEDYSPRWGPDAWTPRSGPSGSRFSMETEGEDNSISKFSWRDSEEDEWRIPKWDDTPKWKPQPRPWMNWSQPRENRFRMIESTGVGAGLTNLGNTCFINAILQCFTHTVPLVLGLLSSGHEKPCDRQKEGFCMLCALCDHIDQSLNSSGWYFPPSNIVENLNHISSFFQKYQQEDAHEFLQCLLDRLESCCSDSKLKNVSPSQDDNLVKQVFGGRLVSQLRCCDCGHCSETYEPLVDFSLEIEDVDSLQSAIESFTKVEKLEDPDAKIKCGNCNQEVAMEKQLLLDQAPLVAAFHLKRFKAGLFVEKITKHVEYPLELDLQPYTIAKQENNVEMKYQLYAVVEHSGYSPTAGHYISYIRSAPDTWHSFNDSRVRNVEGESVLSEEAYILFYVRQDVPWFSSVVEVKTPCLDPQVTNFSPKSVLDNAESASTSSNEAGNASKCHSNESKDGSDRTQMLFTCESKSGAEAYESSATADEMPMQFSPESKNDMKIDKSSAAEGASESEKNNTEINESGADISMTDASVPPRSNDCFEGMPEKNTCSVSPLSENVCNQDVEKARNSYGSSQMPSVSKSQEALYRIPRNHIKVEKRRTPRKSPKKSIMQPQRRGTPKVLPQQKFPTDSETNEAIRYAAKRMSSGRGSSLIKEILEPREGGIVKRKSGSSPCKKPSPRRRHNHGNLISPVPVLR